MEDMSPRGHLMALDIDADTASSWFTIVATTWRTQIFRQNFVWCQSGLFWNCDKSMTMRENQCVHESKSQLKNQAMSTA
jgi:hypothetical protein